MLDLQGLNPPQREAAIHGAGPLVVFAGAGSGKTRVITHRVAQLVSEARVPPWRILAVTFTNKAAREMHERLATLLRGGAEGLWVGTFHAVCARLLRAHAEACEVRPNFVIYDDGDQRAMIARVLRDMGLDDRRYPPKLVASRINRAKQETHGPDSYPRQDHLDDVIQRVYARYAVQMQAAGALDFDDLIYRLVAAMQKYLPLRADVQRRFEYVLVDEFQDTNRVQFELVRLLCEQHQNLCVVGDDDQSIYRWRGADRRNILDFRSVFPAAKIVKLEQNYRSTARILRVANAVITRNRDREPKQLWTDQDDGAMVTVACCEDERMEAEMVVRAIRAELADGRGLGDLALLYRKHAQSRVFEEAMRAVNLPYRVVGGTRFYDRAEVKDILAYLKVLNNPDDDVGLLRIVNTPARGIGKTTMTRILDAAATAGTSVWDALRVAAADEALLGSGPRKKLEAFVAFMDGLRRDVEAGHPPSVLADRVLMETGYTHALRQEDSAEADARLENLRELVGSMQEFEAEAEEPSLTQFLELVTLQTDVTRGAEVGECLTMMTVHAAKGLEFPVVFVAGLEEEMFPNIAVGADTDPDDLEEERRLAYVAFTRARERLMLSYANVRRVYGQLRIRRRSRFLDEIPGEDLQWVGLNPNQQTGYGASGYGGGSYGYGSAASGRAGSSNYGSGSYRGTASGGAAHPFRPAASSRPAPRPAAPNAPPRFVPPGDSYVDRSEGSDLAESGPHAGMRVRHAKFGVGQVVEVTTGGAASLLVRFPGWGTKRIQANYLEPV